MIQDNSGPISHRSAQPAFESRGTEFTFEKPQEARNPRIFQDNSPAVPEFRIEHDYGRREVKSRIEKPQEANQARIFENNATPGREFASTQNFDRRGNAVRFTEPQEQKRSKSTAYRKPMNQGRRDGNLPSWMKDNPRKKQGSRHKSSRPESTKHSRTPSDLDLRKTPLGLDLLPEQAATHDYSKENISSFAPVFYTPTASRLDISDLGSNMDAKTPHRQTQPYSLLSTYNRDDFKVPKTLKTEEYYL